MPAFLSHGRHIALLALAASVALHAALIAGLPAPPDVVRDRPSVTYVASLAPAPAARPAPAPAPPKAAPKPKAKPKPKPRPRPRPRHVARAAPPPAPVVVPRPAPPPPPEPATDAIASAAPEPAAPPATDLGAWDWRHSLAFAAPAALPAPGAPPEKPFPMEALPDRLSIDYRLTTSLVDAQASYRWRRDGDEYRITSQGEATGIFSLFLQGEMTQQSVGTVTSAGLRPERFVETKPGSAREGLEFDWLAHRVTFEYSDHRKTEPLPDDTVDWLTMIFQLAHSPPAAEAKSMRIKVFTQRRLYDFHLNVLGVERIDIPLGRVRALHLRHVDPENQQAVDVWLGIDYHYLPVRMRYPVAHNRFTVEQTATRIAEP